MVDLYYQNKQKQAKIQSVVTGLQSWSQIFLTHADSLP